VTFLFTDVEGSTRRWEADADEMRVALAAHDDVLRTAIEANNAFRLLTRLQSVPIVAALLWVGEFSRAFSKTFDEKYFCTSDCDS